MYYHGTEDWHCIYISFKQYKQKVLRDTESITVQIKSPRKVGTELTLKEKNSVILENQANFWESIGMFIFIISKMYHSLNIIK